MRNFQFPIFNFQFIEKICLLAMVLTIVGCSKKVAQKESVVNVKAPWAGYIATVNVHEGANITPGMNGVIMTGRKELTY